MSFKHAWLVIGALAVGVFPALTRAQALKPPVPREFPRSILPSKIILVGDSTTAVMGGWGPSFCAQHVTSFLSCMNLARGGRSSRTYVQERSWELALAEARVPGYKQVWVVIQFGHNDQPGNSRSTELDQEFPGYIRRYVEDARAAGAIPILVTPLVRRTFGGNGRLVNDLAPWAAAVRKVAEETGVPLIDLNAQSVAAVDRLGPRLSEKLSQLPRGSAPVGGAPRAQTEVNVQPTAVPRLSFDETHVGEKGADFFAAMVADLLARKVDALRPFLIVERRADRRPLDPDGL